MQKIKVGRRVVKASQVSSVQWLCYFRSHSRGMDMCESVWNEGNGFLVTGLNLEYDTLQEACDAIIRYFG